MDVTISIDTTPAVAGVPVVVKNDADGDVCLTQEGDSIYLDRAAVRRLVTALNFIQFSANPDDEESF